jgi:hypothetical protein
MGFQIPEDRIRVGDEFEWCYHGCEGWPHSYRRVRVTRIYAWGDDSLLETEDGDDFEAEAAIEAVDVRDGLTAWNPLGHFREMCRRISPAG